MKSHLGILKNPLSDCLQQGLLSLPILVLVVTVLGQLGCVAAIDMASAIEEAAADHSPLVGEPAPNFRLPDQDDRPVTLEQWRGRWLVLYFYPRDDTAGCKCQATEFTELMDNFERLNTTVVGVSPDTTKSHRLFMQKHRIKITLLSDPEAIVAKKYSAWNQLGQPNDRVGKFIRSTVLIDPAGRIAYHWPEVIPRGHAERVRRKLKRLAKTQIDANH